MKDSVRGEWTSASNALADRLCRGRHQAQQGFAELPPTEESDTGRIIHALWTGTQPLRNPTSEEAEKADALSQQERAVAAEFFGKGEEPLRIVERRLWHSVPACPEDPARGTLRTSGQFDVALVHPASRRALVLDGKSGWLPVTPNPANLQLRRLVALFWLELGCMEIGVCILKPFSRPEPTCIYDVPDLRHSVLEMEQDIRLSHDPDARRTPGLEQCRSCRARESCPERLAWLAPALPVTASLPMISARDWTPAQRALFLDREKEARDWLDARKEELKALLAERPESVPGYRLRPGHMVETITNVQQVFKRFCKDLGGKPEAFLECTKVGKTALREHVRVLTRHAGKVLEAELERLLEGCFKSKQSAPTIERVK